MLSLCWTHASSVERDALALSLTTFDEIALSLSDLTEDNCITVFATEDKSRHVVVAFEETKGNALHRTLGVTLGAYLATRGFMGPRSAHL